MEGALGIALGIALVLVIIYFGMRNE